MIAVDEVGPWIRRDTAAIPDPALALPALEPLGEVDLVGEILDSKCWFGAMRPSQGKPHKACASLCIRGGIPPAFFARADGGHGALMIMRDGGRPTAPGCWRWWPTRCACAGGCTAQGDLLVVDAPLSSIRRL